MKKENYIKRLSWAMAGLSLGIILLWGLFYVLTMRVFKHNIEQQAMVAVDAIMANAENELILMEESAYMLSGDTGVINLALSGRGNEFFDRGAQTVDSLSATLMNIRNADSIVVFDMEGRFYRLKGKTPNTILMRSFFLMQNEPGRVVTVSGGSGSYVGIYEDIFNDGRQCGYVLLMLEESKIERLLSSYNDLEYIGVALYSGDKLVCSDIGLAPEAVKNRIDEAVFVNERDVGLSGYRVVVYVSDSVYKGISIYFNVALPVTVTVLLLLAILLIALIRRHMKTEFELELERTNLTLLKKQISAHFTVNTLNIVRALIGKGDKETATRICNELSALLRYANAGDEYISLLEEFYILEQYTGIMNARYPGRINAQFDEDDSYSDYLVPRMLLQPIVENAFLHGLSGGSGNVEVKASCDEKDLYITVTDDGKGMTPEELEEVLKEAEDEETTSKGSLDHIALANVRKRIRVLFGSEYGIFISSDVDRGTTVTLHLPLVKKTQ